MRFSTPDIAGRARRAWRDFCARAAGPARRDVPEASAETVASPADDAQPLKDACAAIPDLCKSVLAFGSESDAEFTEMAKGLGGISAKMDGLTGTNAALLAALQNEDDKRALSSAYALYRSSVDLVHSSMGIAVSEQERMLKVEEDLRRLCGISDQFQRNGMLFRILTMGIRMEASRIDPEFQTVFLNVAAAIAETERKVAETTDSAFGRILTVVREAEAERIELKAMQEKLHERANESIELLRSELDKVTRALQPCIEDGRALNALLGEYPPKVMRLITALQYQDIVRQQLEHVASGFHDIQSHFDAKREPGTAGDIDHGYIHHATEVQQRHLSSARHEIERAGGTVVEGMRELLDFSDSLAGRFTAMDAAVDAIFSECRIAELFREEITKLAQIGNQSEITNERIGRLVGRIAEVVRVFSEDISRQEFEVILVSLNAQVAAARMSSAAALDKLAEETSTLSGANASLTQQIASQLQAILGFLQGIKAEADEFTQVVRRERRDLEVGAERVGALLAELSMSVRAAASQVNRDFATVHRDVHALLEGLRFPTLIPSIFDPVEAFCARMIALTAGGASTGLSEQGLTLLESHRLRYTMQEEHAAHAAAMGEASAPTALQPAPASVASADSIELFCDAPAPAPAESAAVQQPMDTPAGVAPSVTAAPAEQSADETREESRKTPLKKDDFGDGIELF